MRAVRARKKQEGYRDIHASIPEEYKNLLDGFCHDILKSYIADYRQFEGSSSKRYEYLRKKYISQSPDLTHLIFQDNAILWCVYDIAIVLGRHLTSIIRSISKMKQRRNL